MKGGTTKNYKELRDPGGGIPSFCFWIPVVCAECDRSLGAASLPSLEPAAASLELAAASLELAAASLDLAAASLELAAVWSWQLPVWTSLELAVASLELAAASL